MNAHPLDPLTAEETTAAVAAVRAAGRLTDAARFSTVTLDEPPKDQLDRADRRARLIIVPGPECSLVEAVVAVGSGLAAPVHQHLFCARLDLDVDGPVNEVHEVDVEAMPAGEANRWGNGFAPAVTRLEHELQARRRADPTRSRSWKIVNPDVRNGPGGDGLPRWTAADRSLVGTDVVLWHTFGVTHVPRPEDWPVMPVERCGFLLSPCGFFDANPALDVPPPDHCH